ncbi:MAG: copper-binding protein [Rhizobacter sp.]|nr:copper-binding protein [Rhizobacter sp.]
MIRTTLQLATALCLAIGASTALAHGDDAKKKPGAATVRKEQKAWGIAGDAKAVTRTIEIRMDDTMRFTPDLIEVREGETIRLVHRNKGKLRHEFVLGTKKELDEHAALMVKFPTMEHDEPYMAHVAPGKRGEIVWTFNRAGEFDFACLIAGHYQAGMVGKVRVLAASSAEMIEGEVRKVDKAAKKITLKHGEIKSLDMPPMTMVFQVKDASLLDGLIPGDKLQFAVEKSATGHVVTQIRRSP